MVGISKNHTPASMKEGGTYYTKLSNLSGKLEDMFPDADVTFEGDGPRVRVDHPDPSGAFTNLVRSRARREDLIAGFEDNQTTAFITPPC